LCEQFQLHHRRLHASDARIRDGLKAVSHSRNRRSHRRCGRANSLGSFPRYRQKLSRRTQHRCQPIQPGSTYHSR
jgi:hypothetical protein